MLQLICKAETDLVMIAGKLLETYPESRIFAFYGQMGAGKTTFIKAICQLLGVKDIVQSPTFSIINEYLTPDEKSIFHFDFYRIRNTTEVFDIGYEDYLYSGHYCFIEWPELVETLLPGDTVKVSISGIADRIIEF